MEPLRLLRGHATRTPRFGVSAGGRGAQWLILVTAVALSLFIAPSVLAQGRLTTLVIEPPLSAKLAALTAGLHHEIALCLTGTAQGDTAIARGFVMPVPRSSTPLGSTFSACPPETLALWHNHPIPSGDPPSPNRSITLPRGEPITNPLMLCALSHHDIETTVRLGFPFSVVAVGDASCWWTLDQARAFEQRGLAPGPRVPSQTAGLFPPAGSIASAGQ